MCQQLTIEYCNDTFADLFGYSEPEQLFGRPLPALVAPPDRDRIEVQLRQLASVDRATVSTAATGLTREDGRVPVDLFAGSVQIGDAPLLVASVSGRGSPPTGAGPVGSTTESQHGDPTASFLAELAHDLRNPLTVATGHLELLRQQASLSSPEEKHTEGLTRALTRMETLLDEALAAVGTEPSIERRPVELAEVVDSAWQTVPTDDATLTIDLSQTITADPTKLGRLFENLFRNAVQHGGSDVHVEVGELATPGFYVADNGPGISPADRGRAFEPGYTTHEAGTGLGLAIVSKVVAAHGWQVDITESAAGGARFEIHTDDDSCSVSAS